MPKHVTRSLFLLGFFIILSQLSYSQCNLLTGNRNITYLVDGQCAPTTVTQFTIEYEFISAQTPADISIRFEWNDPGANTDTYSLGDAGFVVSAGDTRYQATGTFAYPVNNDCAFLPTAFLTFQGADCASSEEEKIAISWDSDDSFGGVLAITPPVYEVCAGDAVVNAQFTDNSTFNCNIVAEPDNPNQIERHVQFVYGNAATHNPAATILDLSLEDGGTQPLTNGAGALAAPIGPIGTAGLQITAAYFGPIQNVPFPANGPNAASLLMNAPANALNVVGNTFEVTMFNWNVCNPFNGDAVNPNYDEAISIIADIEIVAAPAPNFVTREVNAGGTITTDFCIGEVVYFDNQTAGGGLNYNWEYFDGPLDTDPSLASSTATNPTYVFLTGGQKLIRLIASNPTAQSACAVQFDQLINVTPTLVADIRVTDLADVDITPHFCQDNTMSQVFDVRFYDIAPGTPTVTTGRRWEFYDEMGVLSSSVPAGVGFVTGVGLVNPPDQAYSTPGNYEVKFITQDGLTGCETEASVFVRIYSDPVADFTATEVCDGVDTHFEDASSLIATNGESIVSYEWDFDYDGITFTKDGIFDNQTSFDRNLGVANTYQVALRVTTDGNACENIIVQDVIVRPIPVATFTANITEGCSVLSVDFTNTGHGSQPANVSQYIWQIDPEQDGTFIDELIQDPSDPSFSTTVQLDFDNASLVDIFVDVRLRAVNEFSCETISGVETITIYPTPLAGFTSLNYDPFLDNCGSISVDFEVGATTQGLAGLLQYNWEVRDDVGAVVSSQANPPAIPDFSFVFTNTSNTDIQDFEVQLTTDFVGGCSSDSIRMIRVNPIPLAQFDIDTVSISCEEIILEMSALQNGLAEYEWEILIDGVSELMSTSLGDTFEHTFARPLAGGSDFSVDIRLQTTNFANCQSMIEQQNVEILAQENISIGFSPTPLIQTEPGMTVTLNNSTNLGPWSYLWEFGDGTTSIDPNEAVHTYAGFGDYLITLTVTSAYCEETTSQLVTIVPAIPVIEFDFIASGGCTPAIVEFTNLSNYVDPTSYVWDFGDGQSSSGVTDPVHVYTSSGFYSVSLTGNNGQGDEVTITKTNIIVVYDPSAVFTSNEVFLDNCGSMSVDFVVDPSVQALPGLLTYTWEVADESGSLEPPTISSIIDPTFQYDFTNTSISTAKTYEVTLTTDFEGSCSASTIKEIVVNPIPLGTFQLDTLVIDCEMMSIQVEAEQKGLSEYRWEIWANGNLSSVSTTDGDVLEQVFPRPSSGNAPVDINIRLQTTNFANCQSTIVQESFQVPVQEDIDVGFDPTPLEQIQPNMTVTLNNTTNSGSWTYLWDFGDGNTSDDPNQGSYTYADDGEYIITLTVTSTYCTQVAMRTIKIIPTIPILDFDFTPLDGCAPLRVDFTNLSQFADATSYVWDFGDGETLQGAANPTHIYTAPGIYNVTLSANNGAGGEASVVSDEVIEVYINPTAIFSVSPEEVVLPNVVFIENKSFSATSYLWDFGDGNTSIEFEPIYEYEDVNIDNQGNEIGYDITLIATNDNGCIDSLTLESVVKARRSNEVLVPNAFSPSLSGPSADGTVDDKTNDVFLPKMNNFKVVSFRMLIFNKWGEMLFESTNKNKGWDGYYKGQLVQQDVYVYRLNLEYDDGHQEIKVGDVTLVR